MPPDDGMNLGHNDMNTSPANTGPDEKTFGSAAAGHILGTNDLQASVDKFAKSTEKLSKVADKMLGKGTPTLGEMAGAGGPNAGATAAFPKMQSPANAITRLFNGSSTTQAPPETSASGAALTDTGQPETGGATAAPDMFPATAAPPASPSAALGGANAGAPAKAGTGMFPASKPPTFPRIPMTPGGVVAGLGSLAIAKGMAAMPDQMAANAMEYQGGFGTNQPGMQSWKSQSFAAFGGGTGGQNVNATAQSMQDAAAQYATLQQYSGATFPASTSTGRGMLGETAGMSIANPGMSGTQAAMNAGAIYSPETSYIMRQRGFPVTPLKQTNAPGGPGANASTAVTSGIVSRLYGNRTQGAAGSATIDPRMLKKGLAPGQTGYIDLTAPTSMGGLGLSPDEAQAYSSQIQMNNALMRGRGGQAPISATAAQAIETGAGKSQKGDIATMASRTGVSEAQLVQQMNAQKTARQAQQSGGYYDGLTFATGTMGAFFKGYSQVMTKLGLNDLVGKLKGAGGGLGAAGGGAVPGLVGGVIQGLIGRKIAGAGAARLASGAAVGGEAAEAGAGTTAGVGATAAGGAGATAAVVIGSVAAGIIAAAVVDEVGHYIGNKIGKGNRTIPQKGANLAAGVSPGGPMAATPQAQVGMYHTINSAWHNAQRWSGDVESAIGGFLEAGGVVPGYAPGSDTETVKLSKGEGVLVPEAVRAMGGAAGIDALNLKHAPHRLANKSASEIEGEHKKGNYKSGGTKIPNLGTTLPAESTMIKYFGQPGSEKNETWVPFAGKQVQVNKVLAGNVKGIGEQLVGAGFKKYIRTVGGFRTSKGASGSPIPFSMHQFGAAIDINEDGGPDGTWNTMRLPQKMTDIFSKNHWYCGINWGGGSQDGGHYQYEGGTVPGAAVSNAKSPGSNKSAAANAGPTAGAGNVGGGILGDADYTDEASDSELTALSGGSATAGMGIANTSTPTASSPKAPGGAPSGAYSGTGGKAVYTYLLNNLFKGNKIAAAGATGSIYGESKWDPESVEPSQTYPAKGDGNGGLIGWSKPGGGGMAAYGIKQTGNRTKDMAQQLPKIIDFVKTNSDMGVIQQMLKAKTVFQAANLWGVGVERFGINDVTPEGVRLASAIAGVSKSQIGLAAGGPAEAGKGYWLGERGPEFVRFNQDANVTNSKDSMKLMKQMNTKPADGPHAAGGGDSYAYSTMSNLYGPGNNSGGGAVTFTGDINIQFAKGSSGDINEPRNPTDTGRNGQAFTKALVEELDKLDLYKAIKTGVK